VLFNALGLEEVKRRAAKGDGEAQFSEGFLLLGEADGMPDGMPLGAAGRSPKADVGLALFTALAGRSQDCDALMCSTIDQMVLTFAGANPKQRRARRFWRRRRGKGTCTLCIYWAVFTRRERNTSRP